MVLRKELDKKLEDLAQTSTAEQTQLLQQGETLEQTMHNLQDVNSVLEQELAHSKGLHSSAIEEIHRLRKELEDVRTVACDRQKKSTKQVSHMIQL